MPVYSLDYSDDLYITVTLEISSEDDGRFRATLHWPTGNLYTQDHIDLASILRLDYYVNNGYWAESIHQVKEEQQLRRRNQQRLSGEELAQAIFVGNLLGFIEDLAYVAQNRTVLLTVFFSSGILDSIPWELLGDPSISLFQSYGLSISVTRGIFRRKLSLPKQKNKVKIVYVTSQPMLYPALHSELGVIAEAIEGNDEIELIWYPDDDITHTKFHKFIRDTTPQILHMALHGEKGKLLFSRDRGDQPIPFTTLVREINEINSIGLAIFNVCYSSASRDNVLFLPGLPRQLVETRTICSIGMATKITDLAAFEFTQWLYMGLSERKSVRQSFHAAIEGLRNDNNPDSILWSVPMLYLNRDVVPFVDFLEKIKREPEYPEVDRVFFQKLFLVCDEYIKAYESIVPSRRWDAIDWKNATRHLLLIFMETQGMINRIEQKIPRTNHLPSRDLFTRILRLRKELKLSLGEFAEIVPDWASLDFSDPDTPNLLYEFMNRAEAVSQGLIILQEEIQGLY